MAIAMSDLVKKMFHEKWLEGAAPCATCGKKPVLSEDYMYDEVNLQCGDHHGVRTSLRKNVGSDMSRAFANMERLVRALVECWNDNMKEAQNGKK